MAATFGFHAGLLVGIASAPYTRPAFRRFEIILPEHLKEFPNRRITYFRPTDLLPAISPESATTPEGLTINRPRPELATVKITRPDQPPQPQSIESARPDPPPRVVESPNFVRPAAPPASAAVPAPAAAPSPLPVSPPPRPTRAFVAPPKPAVTQETPTLADLATTPPLPQAEKPVLAVPLGTLAPETKFAPKPFVAPKAKTAEGKASAGAAKQLMELPAPGTGPVTEAVISINPQGLVPPKLTGNAPASIEAGVSRGVGAGKQPGVPVVPGVAIPGNARPAAPPPPVNLPARPLAPPALGPTRATPDLTTSEVSIGQRPGTRSLPPPVEAFFATRTVYTTSLAIPSDRASGVEWTIWFAEPPGAPPARLMRPPKVAVRMTPAHPAAGPRQYLITRLSAEGTLKVVSGTSDPVLTQTLESWQFRPAQRGNLPVEVDLIVEVLP
jgi:hypothetical protein